MCGKLERARSIITLPNEITLYKGKYTNENSSIVPWLVLSAHRYEQMCIQIQQELV